MFAWLGVLLLTGPLTALPEGWSHHEDLCLDSLCGSYSHPRTGTVISYRVADQGYSGEEPCQVPSLSVSFRGSLGGFQYCGFEAVDARGSVLDEIVRTNPNAWCDVSDLLETLPPAESSLISMTFIKGSTVIDLWSEACDSNQLAVFRELVLSGDHLKIQGFGE